MELLHEGKTAYVYKCKWNDKNSNVIEIIRRVKLEKIEEIPQYDDQDDD